MSLPHLAPRRWWALFLLAAAQFIVILDTSIIGIALPAIQQQLGFAQADLQWIFNVYGVLVLTFSPLVLRRGVTRRGSVDYTAGLAVTGALILAVYAIVAAEAVGWASLQTVGLLSIVAALLVIFVIIQQRRREPLIPLRIFRAPNLSAANVVMGLLGGA